MPRWAAARKVKALGGRTGNIEDSRVISINTRRRFNFTLRRTIGSTQPVIVFFVATWAAQCKTMIPVIAEISKMHEFRHCIFLRVNVDVLKTVTKAARVKKVPTFKFYVLGRPVCTVEGTNSKKLMLMMRKHCDVWRLLACILHFFTFYRSILQELPTRLQYIYIYIYMESFNALHFIIFQNDKRK